MAKEVNLQFSGSMGPLVGVLRNGNYYYRSRPAKLKQTKATKKVASQFGMAAQTGRVLRGQLAPAIPNPKDQDMQRRLQQVLRQWLALENGLPKKAKGDIPQLLHFNFSGSGTLEEKLRIAPVCQISGKGQVLLQIPAFNPAKKVTAPAGTTHLEICLAAASVKPGNETSAGSSKLLTIPYSDSSLTAQELVLQLPQDRGQLMIAILQLRFGIKGAGGINYDKHADKAVAAIVGAQYQ